MGGKKLVIKCVNLGVIICPILLTWSTTCYPNFVLARIFFYKSAICQYSTNGKLIPKKILFLNFVSGR